MKDDYEELLNQGKKHLEKKEYQDAILKLELALEKSFLMGSDRDAIIVNEYLGKTYAELKDHDRAIKYYKDNLTLYEDLQDKKRTIRTLNKIGLVLMAKKDYKGALNYHMKCLEACQNENDRENEAIALKNIGMIHSQLGNHVLSLKAHTASLDIKRNLGDRRGEALGLYFIGQNKIDTGNYGAARENLEKAYKIFKNMGLKEDCEKVNIELDELDELEAELDLELEYTTKIRGKHKMHGGRFPADDFLKW